MVAVFIETVSLKINLRVVVGIWVNVKNQYLASNGVARFTYLFFLAREIENPIEFFTLVSLLPKPSLSEPFFEVSSILRIKLS